MGWGKRKPPESESGCEGDKSDVDLMNDDETALARVVLALRTFMRLSGSHISSGRQPEKILARPSLYVDLCTCHAVVR